MTSPALGFLVDREPFMAIFHAYFDESGKHHDHPVVTFSGVCIPSGKLLAFDDAWEGLLRRYGLDHLHTFKVLKNRKLSPLIHAESIQEKIEALKPFADCINEHMEMGLIEAMDVKGFNSLTPQVKQQLGSPDDPYFIAFARAMLHLESYVKADDLISLICDDDQTTALSCYAHYRAIRKVHDQVRKKTISLTFADDEHFPALQAADMVAFLSRLEAKQQFYDIRYSYKNLFDYLVLDRGPGKTKWMKMFATESVMKSLMQGMANTKGISA